MAKRTKKKAGKRRAKTKARSKKAPSFEMLMVTSKVKQALRNHDVNVASDAVESLNGVVHWYIQQAASRAAANGRKTVRAHDFMVG
ncbi:MAG: hypothetical protein JSV80_13220 [Acidobacteriota bacterium]|nr:MAG: hypothetical protein JSV80_13220 [Acidobacteriota bacterium]